MQQMKNLYLKRHGKFMFDLPEPILSFHQLLQSINHHRKSPFILFSHPSFNHLDHSKSVIINHFSIVLVSDVVLPYSTIPILHRSPHQLSTINVHVSTHFLKQRVSHHQKVSLFLMKVHHQVELIDGRI